MASSSLDDRYYIAVDASEMDKIDKALRLSGLKFSKNNPVLGRKKAGLILALGAFDTKHNHAGKQLVVVRRLCVLYDALLNIHKNHPALDINSDTFYEAAIDHISKRNKDSIAKFLNPPSLQHVIELYRKAFHYGGLKPKKPNAKKAKGAQEASSIQCDAPQLDAPMPDVPQANDNGGDASIDEALGGSPKLGAPLDPIGDRVTLEKLVTEWIIVRAIARRNEATAEKPETTDSPHPEQTYVQSVKTNELGLEQTSGYYGEERKPREEDSIELPQKMNEAPKKKNEMLKERNEVLKERYEALKEQYELLKREGELLKRKREVLEKQSEGTEWIQDTTGGHSDKINETDQLLSMNEDRQGQVYHQREDRGQSPAGLLPLTEATTELFSDHIVSAP